MQTQSLFILAVFCVTASAQDILTQTTVDETSSFFSTTTPEAATLIPGTSSPEVLSPDSPSTTSATLSSFTESTETNSASITESAEIVANSASLSSLLPSSTLTLTSTPTVDTNVTATEDDTHSEETQLAAFDGDEIPPSTPQRTIQENNDLTTAEIQTYANIIMEGGIPLGEGEISPPVVLPHCPDTNLSGVQKRASLPKYQITPCIFKSIRIKVAVFYVTDGTKSVKTDPPKIPSDTRTRIINNIDLLRTVFRPLKIDFDFDENADLQPRRDRKFSRHNSEAYSENDKFKKLNRVSGTDTLNIWIVNSIDKSPSSTTTTNGYAFIPETPLGDRDGVVLAVQALSPVKPTAALYIDPNACEGAKRFGGGALIHEVGHWMGLEHTFGDEDDSSCNNGDGITDTPLFSKNKQYCCRQSRCNASDGEEEDEMNWMSYSACRGTKFVEPGSPRALNLGTSFSNGQKTVMFATFSKFRRYIPCLKVNYKRSGELEKREETQAAELVSDLLLKNCSLAIQEVFDVDSIPLPPSKLSSISSAAASVKATPLPEDPYNPRPATRTVGTLTAIPTTSAAADETESASASRSTPNSGATTQVKLRGKTISFLIFVLVVFM